ncbi:Chemotaxis protein methyltransferase CheR [Brevinematales bacterium NS]|jgi:chemotaxis protein methyltransferase CheR|nr:Chemotaxis protein methyltransferase CheR [Brevinematales bacterium NS]
MMSAERLEAIRERINSVTGIKMGKEKDKEILTTFLELCEKHNLSEDLFYQKLQTDNQTVMEFATQFTVHETSFYRNKDHFKTLEEHLFPSLLSQSKELRILSAGCATGEEPYTIAMILHKILGENLPLYKIDIIGLDISPNAIETAQKGIYNEYKMKNIPNELLQNYFIKHTTNTRTYYTIIPQIKNMVSFHTYNLLAKDGFLEKIGPFDIILCENVIIYFDHAAIQYLIDTFYKILKQPGYLFVGYSETLATVEHAFQLKWHEHTYYYEKTPVTQKKEEEILQGFPSPLQSQTNILHKEHPEYSYEEIYYQLSKHYLKQDINQLMQWHDIFLHQLHQGSDFIKDEKIYLLLGEFFLDQNDTGNAFQMAEMAIEKNPRSIDALNLQAYTQTRTKDYQKAMYTLQIALQIEPHHPISLLLLYKLAEINQNHTLLKDILQKLKGCRETSQPYKELFPYQPARKIQFYSEINKICQEISSGAKKEL